MGAPSSPSTSPQSLPPVPTTLLPVVDVDPLDMPVSATQQLVPPLLPLPSTLLAMATLAPSTRTPTWLATPTVLLSPLMSQLLLPPVPTTSPPGMPSTLPLPLLLSLPLPLLLPPSPPPSPPSLLLVDFTLEPLLHLTATEPDTVTAWWPTPTALLSPWTNPLFRPRVPTTSLPRERSTREPRKSLLFIV